MAEKEIPLRNMTQNLQTESGVGIVANRPVWKEPRGARQSGQNWRPDRTGDVVLDWGRQRKKASYFTVLCKTESRFLRCLLAGAANAVAWRPHRYYGKQQVPPLRRRFRSGFGRNDKRFT